MSGTPPVSKSACQKKTFRQIPELSTLVARLDYMFGTTVGVAA
jgi:hypothetical protein